MENKEIKDLLKEYEAQTNKIIESEEGKAYSSCMDDEESCSCCQICDSSQCDCCQTLCCAPCSSL